MTPQEFIRKWKPAALTERASAQDGGEEKWVRRDLFGRAEIADGAPSPAHGRRWRRSRRM